ncbi:uncharacterized protein BDR25DRAFT_348540 [Lindgomyces ingoldianus]|uniref:Uncharacterized protein n=1 Tax=Lindgomyces ingoldianus TaxID=673940 RepID=A0ACB6RG95_9PLEO|nr:uncharacterized protein BDR25DRAFT_348540 [Lindgomyces ingoldianus]KAF2478274.1 hypothetical protein BDR25DRAFT_348540 [Lindgomyces ingoldianus]
MRLSEKLSKVKCCRLLLIHENFLDTLKKKPQAILLGLPTRLRPSALPQTYRQIYQESHDVACKSWTRWSIAWPNLHHFVVSFHLERLVLIAHLALNGIYQNIYLADKEYTHSLKSPHSTVEIIQNSFPDLQLFVYKVQTSLTIMRQILFGSWLLRTLLEKKLDPHVKIIIQAWAWILNKHQNGERPREISGILGSTQKRIGIRTFMKIGDPLLKYLMQWLTEEIGVRKVEVALRKYWVDATIIIPQRI